MAKRASEDKAQLSMPLLREAEDFHDIDGKLSDGEGGKVLRTLCLPRNQANILVMTLGFFLLFTAFNTTQFFAVKLLPGDLGANSLAVLYAVFSLATFMAPACVSKFGVKRCLFFGAFGYVTYIASLIYIIPLLVLLCSCFIGVGAAILWTAQAQYMTQNTVVENRGLWTGIFWGLFQMCIIPGNVAAVYILSDCNPPPSSSQSESLDYTKTVGFSGANTTLFIVLSLAGAAGCLVFLTLRNPDPKYGSSVDSQERPLREKVLGMLKMLGNPRMILLLPMMFFTGLNNTFYAAWFTRQILSCHTGLVLLALGAGEMVGAYMAGKVSDTFRNGQKIVLFSATAMQAAALYLSISANASGDYRNFFAPAALLGLADACFQPQVMSYIGTAFTSEVANAGAINKLLQSVGAMTAFFITPLFGRHSADPQSFLYEVIVDGALLAAGVIGVSIFLLATPASKLSSYNGI